MTGLNAATSTLRTQSSTFGSNLSVVQNRQDFTKNLTNILRHRRGEPHQRRSQRGGGELAGALDPQSLAISALSLANQAQQGILQLLR